jgi:hypothetical protein
MMTEEKSSKKFTNRQHCKEEKTEIPIKIRGSRKEVRFMVRLRISTICLCESKGFVIMERTFFSNTAVTPDEDDRPECEVFVYGNPDRGFSFVHQKTRLLKSSNDGDTLK